MVVDRLLKHLTHTELIAIARIHEAMDGKQQKVIVNSIIADNLKITRSVMVAACRLLAVAGVIETTSLGMKGTHIRVLQPEIFDQVAQAAYELEAHR